MRKNHLIIVLLFLNSIKLYGQSRAKVINNIDKIVASTSSDTTIQKVIVDMKPYNGDDEEKSRQPITVFLKDNKILKISFCNNCNGNSPLIEGGIFIDYYLENEELCFVNHQDKDYSRPGSCGYVNIVNKFYFKKDKLLKSIKEGDNPCKPLGKINEDFLAESQLTNFDMLFKIVKDKKPNR